MSKRILSILLTLALLVSLVPAALAEEIVIVEPEIPEDFVGADAPGDPEDDDPIPVVDPDALPPEDELNETASGFCGKNLTWTYDSDTRTLTISGTGPMYDYRREGDDSWHPVDRAPWKDYRNKIVAVVIEEGVTHVTDSAFYACSKMKSVSIPSSVCEIDRYAFQGCDELEEVNITDLASWCQMKFPLFFDYKSSNPLTFAHKLYLDGELITDLVIPDGVTVINMGVFYECRALTSVTIPEGVKTIGSYAFQYCRNIKTITIPTSLTEIGGYAFTGCNSLSGVYISDVDAWSQIAFYYHEESNPLKYAHKLYLNGKLLTELVLSDGITSVSERAFFCCTSLTSVKLPNSVTNIGENAFSGCTNLKTIGFPADPPDIGSYSFSSVTARAYYPEDGGWWAEDRLSYGGNLTWVPYHTLYTLRFDLNGGGDGWSQLKADGEAVLIQSAPKRTDWLFYGWGDSPAAVKPIFVPGDTCTADADLTLYALWTPREWTEPVTVSCSTNGITLSWDAIYGVDGYGVYRPVDGYYPPEIGYGRDAQFTDGNVQMGQTYSYLVRGNVLGEWTNFSEPVEVFFNPFSDVSGKKTIEYVAWAFNNGIVNGTSTTRFSPDDPCTRIQFVMMLWKMHGSPVVEGKNPFSDISGKKTTNAILWALDAGVINSGKTFNPNGNISRVQIVMMLWKLAGSPNVTGDNPFVDVSGSKTTKAVLWAYQNGITKGTDKTHFAPDADCTRVQLVVFLYKYNGIYNVI